MAHFFCKYICTALKYLWYMPLHKQDCTHKFGLQKCLYLDFRQFYMLRKDLVTIFSSIGATQN